MVLFFCYTCFTGGTWRQGETITGGARYIKKTIKTVDICQVVG